MCSWPELWLRWVQFGVMSPVFRTHCEAECSCQPWEYMVDDVYEAAITAAFQLREQLMPYIYTAAHEAYATGVTINHPVYYDHPEHDEAYSEAQRQSYLFGPSALVAAIVSWVTAYPVAKPTMSALTGPCWGDSSRKQQQRGTPHRTHSLDPSVSRPLRRHRARVCCYSWLL